MGLTDEPTCEQQRIIWCSPLGSPLPGHCPGVGCAWSGSFSPSTPTEDIHPVHAVSPTLPFILDSLMVSGFNFVGLSSTWFDSHLLSLHEAPEWEKQYCYSENPANYFFWPFLESHVSSWGGQWGWLCPVKWFCLGLGSGTCLYSPHCGFLFIASLADSFPRCLIPTGLLEGTFCVGQDSLLWLRWA